MNFKLLRQMIQGAFELFRDRIHHHFREQRALNQFTVMSVPWENLLSFVNINSIDLVEINVFIESFREIWLRS